MSFQRIETPSKRLKIMPGLVFAFPCTNNLLAIGIVCVVDGFFFMAVFDEQIPTLELEIDDFLCERSVVLGFWTSDALFYHKEWIPLGYTDLDRVRVENASCHLNEVARKVKFAPIESRSSRSPAGVKRRVSQYFMEAEPDERAESATFDLSLWARR